MKYLATLISLLTLALYGGEKLVVLPIRSIPTHLKIDSLIQVDQIRIARLLAGGLFVMGDKLQIEGNLAKNSYWDKTGKQLHIEIKKVHFSDGSVLDTNSVIKSLLQCISTSHKNTTSAFTKITGYRDFISGKNKNLKGLTQAKKIKL